MGDHALKIDSPINPDAWAQEQYNLAIGYLQDFPDNAGAAIERAILALNNAQTVYTDTAYPKLWARIVAELGACYLSRKINSKDANLELAIRCFSKTLTVYESQMNPLESGECHQGIARAYSRIAKGSASVNSVNAFEHYRNALLTSSKDNWPELWHIIHFELSGLFSSFADRILSYHQLAEDHFQMAFDFDQHKYPALFSSLRTLADLYDKRTTVQHALARRVRERM